MQRSQLVLGCWRPRWVCCPFPENIDLTRSGQCPLFGTNGARQVIIPHHFHGSHVGVITGPRTRPVVHCSRTHQLCGLDVDSPPCCLSYVTHQQRNTSIPEWTSFVVCCQFSKTNCPSRIPHTTRCSFCHDVFLFTPVVGSTVQLAIYFAGPGASRLPGRPPYTSGCITLAVQHSKSHFVLDTNWK